MTKDPSTQIQNEDPPIVPVQMLIWESADVHQPIEEETRWTKDLIALVDVPVSSNQNIVPIEVVTQGLGETKHVNQVPGKVILRMAPHPEWVVINDRVVRREQLSQADRGRAKAIMTEQMTTILYHGGVVKPFHLVVMYGLLHGLQKRWETTGQRSGTLTLTKTEILDFINEQQNGRTRQAIEEALETLHGLQVHKIFHAPKPGKIGHGQVGDVIQRMGGIISNYTILRGAGNSSRGVRPDLIEVTFNPSLITSLTSGADQREWSLRTLNFTRALRITEAWKRQLYCLLESRLQQVGYLFMPMKELWIGCLGQNELDALDGDRWRQARHRLKRVFDEFVQTGYITDFEILTHRRNLKQVEAEYQQRPSIRIDLQEGGKTTANVTGRAPYSLDSEREWIRCNPGPEFTAQSPKRKGEFAQEIIVCLIGKAKAGAYIASIETDSVIEMTNARIKHIAMEIGDLHKRMSQLSWFDTEYPMAPAAFLFRLLYGEYLRRESCAVKGEPFIAPQAPHFFRRRRVLTRSVMRRLTHEGIAIDEVATGKATLTDQDGDITSALQLAMREVAKDIYPGPEIWDEQHRMLYPEKERSFQQIVKIATEVGFAVGVLTKWHNFIAKKVGDHLRPYIQKLGADKDSAAWYQAAWKADFGTFMQKYPEVTKLVEQLDKSWGGANTAMVSNLEAVVADRIRRRMVEHLVEVRELEIVEQREGLSAPSDDEAPAARQAPALAPKRPLPSARRGS